MADLTDEQLPDYCETHCRTERALFHSRHLNRMPSLAGHPPDYHKTVPEGWYTVRENTMDPLVKLARERRTSAGASTHEAEALGDKGESHADQA